MALILLALSPSFFFECSSFSPSIIFFYHMKKRNLRKGEQQPPLSLQKGEAVFPRSPYLQQRNRPSSMLPLLFQAYPASAPLLRDLSPSIDLQLRLEPPSSAALLLQASPHQAAAPALPQAPSPPWPSLLFLKSHLPHSRPDSSSPSPLLQDPLRDSSRNLLESSSTACPFSSIGNDCSSPKDPLSSGAAASLGSRRPLQILLHRRASLLQRRATSLVGDFFIAVPLLSPAASSSPCSFSSRALRHPLTFGHAQLLTAPSSSRLLKGSCSLSDDATLLLLAFVLYANQATGPFPPHQLAGDVSQANLPPHNQQQI